jgi:ABC-type sugar transport system ATPase subunit
MKRVRLEGVTLSYGSNVVVEELTLDIHGGAFFSLLGPSGCGKTTTMRVIAGLETPQAGRVWIGDDLVFDAVAGINLPAAARKLGMVFQNYALWPHMTVRDNILFGLRVRRVPKVERERRLGETLERLQIADLAERYPNELSGGQQQRIALARELITGSKVILMDEPLSNLDAKLRIDMRVELKQLHEETGGTIIYVTHDQLEALTLSSEMAIMREGVLQQVAPPGDVFRRPANLFVASFMGSAPINLFEMVHDGAALVGMGARLPIPPDLAARLQGHQRVKVAARPEELSLSCTTTPWSLPGVVTSVLPTGYDAFVRVALAHDSSEQATVEHDLRRGEWRVGEEVQVVVDPATVHLFDAEHGTRI